MRVCGEFWKGTAWAVTLSLPCWVAIIYAGHEVAKWLR
jgi:hypothetical protein